MSTQIVSKDRVKEHGEVFTPQKIVTEMHDLIPNDEWSKKDFIYLEPTCGRGVFILDAVTRKLDAGLTIEQAINTVFGMDIQKDNITVCHKLLMDMVYESTKDENVQQHCLNIIKWNIFVVTDSLLWMEQDISKVPNNIWPDWFDSWDYPGLSLIEALPFWDEDPTGSGNVKKE